MSIGQNIKRLRESAGLSQVELGEIAGVSDKAVSTWELDLKNPRMGAVEKISKHFNIPKSVILDDNNEHIVIMNNSIDKITALLKKNDISEESFCKDLNISYDMFDEWKCGKSKPAIFQLIKIADYFGVSVSHLEDDEDKQRKLKMQKALEDLENDNTNTVIVLGKGGDRKVVHVSDEDSVLVQSFLDRLFGDKEE